jgi:hypothetical protein
MLKIYCQDCGSPTTYSNVKPKFCSSCGKPFDKNIVVNPVQLQKPTITKPQNIKIKKPVLRAEDYDDEDDIYDDEDEGIASVPDINKLDFEVAETRPNKIKMGDIISDIPESALGGKDDSKPTQKNKKSKKVQKTRNQEFLNQFKDEAGTLRPSSRRNRNSLDG